MSVAEVLSVPAVLLRGVQLLPPTAAAAATAVAVDASPLLLPTWIAQHLLS